MGNRYRIVKDNYLGYQVDIKYWWFPFCWFQCKNGDYVANTFHTIERAKEFIEYHKKKLPYYLPMCEVKAKKWEQ